MAPVQGWVKVKVFSSPAAKPVGLVWFGVAGPLAQSKAEKQLFAGDRDAVRRQAVAHGLALITAAAHAARQP